MRVSLLLLALSVAPLSAAPIDYQTALEHARSVWASESTAPVMVQWRDLNPCDKRHGNPDMALTQMVTSTMTVDGQDGQETVVSRSWVITLNSSCSWNDVSMEQVMLHEYGHTLGLGHSRDQKSIMFWIVYDGRRQSVTDQDRASLRLLMAGTAAVGK